MMTAMQTLTEKYRPKSEKELVGNREAIRQLKEWLSQWLKEQKPKTKAVLLIGPAGVGKTSATYALANDFGLEVIEINASDTRDTFSIERIIGNAAITMSLSDNKGKIILVDEVDGIHGNFDRGGLSALKKVIKNTQFPIVLTANDPESSKIDQLRKIVEIIEFHRVSEIEIFTLLTKITKKEKKKVDTKKLQIIAEVSQGDLRGALNELQSIFDINISFEKFVEQYIKNIRNHQTTILETIHAVFNAETPDQARQALFSVPTSDYSWLLRTIIEALLDYRKVPITEKSLLLQDYAHADLVLTRIRKENQWRLLKYFFFDIGYKATLHRKTKIPVHSLKIPQLYIELSRYKKTSQTIQSLSEKLSKKLHMPPRKIKQEIIPPLRIIATENPVKGAEIMASLDFTDDEISTILSKDVAAEVFQNIEKAREKVGKSRIKSDIIESPFEVEIKQDENKELTGYLKTEKEEIKEKKEEVKQEEKEDEKDQNQSTLDQFF